MQETSVSGTARYQTDGGAAREYNYERFMPGILMKDAQLIQHPQGTRPGDKAPGFSLRDTQGKQWRLQDLQGRPLIF